MKAVELTVITTVGVAIITLSVLNIINLAFTNYSSGFLCCRVLFITILLSPSIIAHIPELIFYARFIESEATEGCMLYSIAMVYFFLFPSFLLTTVHGLSILKQAINDPKESTESTLKGTAYITLPKSWKKIQDNIYYVIAIELLLGVGLFIGMFFIEPRNCNDFNETALHTLPALYFTVYACLYHKYRYLVNKNSNIEPVYVYNPLVFVCILSLLFLLALLLSVIETYLEEQQQLSMRRARLLILLLGSFLVKNGCICAGEGFFIEKDRVFTKEASDTRLDHLTKRRILKKHPAAESNIMDAFLEAEGKWKLTQGQFIFDVD